MKNTEKFERALHFFRESYKYKMGGTQRVILPNGKSRKFDDREYYSGKGSKYNTSIKHDNIGDIVVSKKEYSDFLNKLRKQEKERNIRITKQKEQKRRIKKAKENGVYSVNENYIELDSNDLDVKMLAKTLNISVADCELLNSMGKTYVFAQIKNSENFVKMFHPARPCNPLNINISYVTKKEFDNFKKHWGEHGGYAPLLGQTANQNHFVC